MRLGGQDLRPALAAMGLVALLAAAGLYLVLEEFALAVRLLLALGVLLLGTLVALDPEDFLRRLSAPRALYAGNTTFMVLALIGILGALNALGARYVQRWDLTASQQYTLSERTSDLLSRLEQPVKVTGFFGAGDPRQREAEDLLKEYRLRSDGKLEWEFVDPEVEPARAVSLGVREFGTLVFQQGPRRQTTTGVTEQEFTTALLKLTRPEAKKVYFIQGHGERELDSPDQHGYSSVTALLQQDNYEVRTLNLVTDQKVPADAAAVVIAGPTKDFLKEEKEALREFLAGGGKLLVLLDPRVEADLNQLFSQWKVSVGKHTVVDPGSAFLGDSLTPVIQRYGPHPITDKLRAASFLTVAAPLHFPSERLEGVAIVPLALSTERSWAETDAQTARFDEELDQRGPLAMALAVEASATSPERRGDAGPGGPSGPRKTRAVIFGDSDFIANSALRVPAANVDFFLNAVNWLAEAEELISIRPKEREFGQLFLTGTQLNLIFVTSTIFLPLIVALAGAAVWWSRR